MSEKLIPQCNITQCHVMFHGRKRRSSFHIKLRDLGVECRDIPNAGKSIDHKYCLPFRFGHMQFLIDLRFTGDCAGEVCKSQNRCNCKWMSSSGYKTNLRQFIFAQSLSLFCHNIFWSLFPTGAGNLPRRWISINSDCISIN